MINVIDAHAVAIVRWLRLFIEVFCFNQRPAPQKTNATAVFGFIVAKPGRMLLKAAISSHQPIRTKTPVMSAVRLTTVASKFVDCVVAARSKCVIDFMR